MPISVILFVFTIVVLSFGFGALAINWQNKYKLDRERIRSQTDGKSLGTGELRGLIQEAMLDAIAPLEERLDLIETHMRQLPEHTAKTQNPDEQSPDDAN